MRTPSLVAAVSAAMLLPALALALAPAATAAPAAKAVKVTIKDLPAASDVGEKVKVAGKVTGAKSDKVTVLVQRRYVGGDWKTVGKDVTDKKGKYSLKVPLAQGGPTSFRAKVGTTKSAVESLAVYQWLDVASQPQVLYSQGALLHRTSTVAKTSYRQSYELPGEYGFLALKADGLCTELVAGIGILDSETAEVPDGASNVATLFGYTPDAGEPTSTELQAPVGPAVQGEVDLTGHTFALIQVDTSSTGSDRWTGTILSPRVRCNATVLSSIEADEIPL